MSGSLWVDITNSVNQAHHVLSAIEAPVRTAKWQYIHSSKSEIRKNFKGRNVEKLQTNRHEFCVLDCLHLDLFGSTICFEFRYSDFGFYYALLVRNKPRLLL